MGEKMNISNPFPVEIWSITIIFHVLKCIFFFQKCRRVLTSYRMAQHYSSIPPQQGQLLWNKQVELAGSTDYVILDSDVPTGNTLSTTKPILNQN
jgi:hypothetical protein